MTTSNDTSLDSFISSLVAQCEQGESLPVVTVTRNATPRPLVQYKGNKPASKLAQVKAAKAAEQAAQVAEQTVSNDKRPALVVLQLPKAGTLDAKGYFTAQRRAKTRDERIVAIAGYIGYDVSAQYAEQEMAANMKANRTLRPITPLAAPVHTALPTLKGYVAGMPDMMSRSQDNLQGRQVVAAEQVADLMRKARDASDPAVKFGAVKMAQVECQRLMQIRKDLGLPVDGVHETFQELETMSHNIS
jgi:hypothetical protein